MRHARIGGLVLMTLAAAGWCWLGSTAEAQKTKGKTRAASTKQLMKGLVGENCGGLKKALDATPTNWDDVALKAALLNESGYMLMDDGRCPDGEWAKSAKALQAAAKAVLEKAEAKDLDGAKAAFKDLTTQSCAVCHAAHKGK